MLNLPKPRLPSLQNGIITYTGLLRGCRTEMKAGPRGLRIPLFLNLYNGHNSNSFLLDLLLGAKERTHMKANKKRLVGGSKGQPEFGIH